MPYPPGVSGQDIDRLSEGFDWWEEAHEPMTREFLNLLEKSKTIQKWTDNELDDCRRQGMDARESGVYIENKYWEEEHDQV